MQRNWGRNMTEAVVSLEELEDGIVQITMHDKTSKNTFSRQLTESLFEAYAKVSHDPRYKVVILTGYDNYFSLGGTKGDLLTLQEGEHFFNEIELFRLAIDCEIPVISAMQGHAIGGGFAMGLFSDFIVLSKESIYSASFMKYGFTPGMGATYILPKRLGYNIAYEMLLNGQDFQGAELAKRGTTLPVVPRNEVLPYAYELATGISEKPRISLVSLKKHLIRSIKENLAEVIKQEVEMHKVTFHRPEVRRKIEEIFA
jgi:4-carboxy-3-alkylbut-2-enoyl-[acp] decarboxylase